MPEDCESEVSWTTQWYPTPKNSEEEKRRLSIKNKTTTKTY